MPGGNSVGQVSLDLVLNRNPFDRQMNNLQQTYKGQLNNLQSMTGSAMGKIGKMLAGGLSLAGLTAFAKKCIDLGSDLSEVQNVVDVTFSSMSGKVNEFAQNAATSFGLSETMAKQFTGTFGAMSKAFGFAEADAYEMSTTLAGLAGDVASFYNLDQEDAFTKLKAVFTGETEGLKSLGVVMTQSALDQFALANGFGKVTAKMTEQEKVALRYQFVLNKLNGASGDFMRTSDGWANQVRVLKLQFESLSATIGQGLINVLTPVIKVINSVMAGLVKLAQAFKGFTELITGKKSSAGSGVADMSGMADLGTMSADAGSGMEDAAGAAENLSDSTSGVGAAAKKAAKEMRSLMGFDQINKLSDNSSAEDSGVGTGGSGGSGGSGSGIGAGVGAVGALDFGQLAKGEEDAAGMSKIFDGLIKKALELRDIFTEGFAAGLGGVSFEPLKEKVESIVKQLRDIFGSKEVQTSANHFLETFTYSLGQGVGAVASVGISLATNLVGGIEKYLSQNKERIKEFIIGSFDAASEISAMAGNYAQAVANIFSVIGGETGQQLTANIIGIFSNAFMGVIQLGLNFVRDITNVITQPIIDNQESIKAALEGLLGVFATVTAAIKLLVDGVVSKALQVYEEHFKPMFDSIANGLSSIVSTMMEGYTQYILPVLQGLADKLGPFVEEYILPMVDSMLEFIGTVADLFTTIWQTVLVPFINWFIETILPVVAPVIEEIGNDFFAFGAIVSTVVKSIFDTLGGIIKFITAVFKGDWKGAWEAIQQIFSSRWNAIKTVVNIVWNWIVEKIQGKIEEVKTKISTGLAAIKEKWNSVWEKISGFLSTVWTTMSTKVTNAIGTVKTVISTVLAAIKTKWNEIWEKISSTLSGIWKTISSTVTDTVGSVKKTINEWLSSVQEKWEEVWGKISEYIGPVWEGISSTISTTAETIKEAIGGITDFLGNVFAGDWEQVWNDISGAFETVWSGFADIVRDPVNSIIDFINVLLRGVEGMVNWIADALNGMSIEIPDWVPGIGGGYLGFNLPYWYAPQLDYLAQGGYVGPNSPRLAMIGDNPREGEIVSPESKIRELTGEAITQNADVIAERIADRIQDVMAGIAMMNNNAGRAEKDVILMVDSVEIARACIHGQNKLDWKLNPSVQYS